MHDRSWALSILGLPATASQDDIRQTYKDLVNVWHPDRFEQNARLRAKAEEKLREINEAFELLKAESRSEPPPPIERTNSEPTTGGTIPPSASSAPELKLSIVLWILFLGALLFLCIYPPFGAILGVAGLVATYAGYAWTRKWFIWAGAIFALGIAVLYYQLRAAEAAQQRELAESERLARVEQERARADAEIPSAAIELSDVEWERPLNLNLLKFSARASNRSVKHLRYIQLRLTVSDCAKSRQCSSGKCTTQAQCDVVGELVLNQDLDIPSGQARALNSVEPFVYPRVRGELQLAVVVSTALAARPTNSSR